MSALLKSLRRYEPVHGLPRSRQLVSLWGIMETHMKSYAGEIARDLVQLERELSALGSKTSDDIPDQERNTSLDSIAERLRAQATELKFSVTPLNATNLSHLCKNPRRVHHLKAATENLLVTMLHELDLVQFMRIPGSRLEYAQAKPFGHQVWEKFPSAEYDVCEAGMCFVCGRWTATVMHCMRILEFGLDALAKALKIKRGMSGWGRDLGNLQAKWDDTLRAANATKKPDLGWRREFFPKVLTEFRYFETAWRNHAVHAHAKYGEEEATRVFEHVRTYMQLISERLKEPRKKRLKTP